MVPGATISTLSIVCALARNLSWFFSPIDKEEGDNYLTVYQQVFQSQKVFVITLLLHVEHVTINQPGLILLLDSLQFYRNFRRQPGLTWLYEQCSPSEEIFWKDFHSWLIHMWICVTFSFSRECTLILFINFQTAYS